VLRTGHRFLAERQNTDNGGDSIGRRHPKRPELVDGRALVLRDDVGRDGRWQVRVLEHFQVQVVQRRGLDGALVEREQVEPSLLG
jgi:hypothetical protein